MNSSEIRTDLALEVRESFPKDNVEIEGVILKEDYDEKKHRKVTTVVIKDEQGANAMGKPIGTYITIEDEELDKKDEDYHQEISKEVARYLKQLSAENYKDGVLVVGLGNREVTPDALGPFVVDNLFVTRHLQKEFGREFMESNKLSSISAVAPGVMAQTGMETLEILKGIIKETKPGLVIAVDALAARSVRRLASTIQITDTGICPGAGVGNNRQALNKESLGIDVIALGVPTVVDAATIVRDSMEQMLVKQGFSENEIGCFLSEVSNEPGIGTMFVTPKDIDESIKALSFTVSEAINTCFTG